MTTVTATRRSKKQWVWSAKQQLCTSNMLFLYTSLPWLHDYDMNFPKRLFMEDLNTRWQVSLSPFKLGCGPQEFNSTKIHLHSIFHESRNNGDKIWKKSEVFVMKFLLLSLLLKLPERLPVYWAVHRSYRAVLGCERDWLSIVLNCTMGYLK